jgi:lysozyme family protein
MTFDDAFTALLGNEGGLSMEPNDRGNWTSGIVGQGLLKGTKYGISAMSFPGEDIANMTIDRAKDIYLRQYWGPAGCDTVPDSVKFDLFDMAVNSGVRNAVKNLQSAAGLSGGDVDGILGSHTLQAIQSTPETRLWARFQGARLRFIVNSTVWAAEGRGLINRIANNLMRA